ncbi:magnesium transporter MgtE N-terminal domain-containing protein [Fodinicola acaciae]|uniref:magnesium transporter MgtE N-terminal domain-containing protein n=1 Tax=Fodinicola acaciae TaxID=2681555 RepID=UPI0013D0DB6C|nr:CBS domain-containing protein [Fodinicola acaciae]
MTTATRIFLARLAGIAVFDPNAEPVGKIRDAVVRLGSHPPRVTGLVVDITQRRRIFVPIDRISSLDVDAVVLRSGTVSLKRFEKRLGETLVLGELLDRRVTMAGTGTAATVIDVAMEKSRGGDWLVSRLAVRQAAPSFLQRRRGQLHQVEWDDVTGLAPADEDQAADTLIEMLSDMKPADVANLLHDLPEKRRNEVAAALEDERLADVLQEMPEADQIAILKSLDTERAADVLEAMDPDDAADLLAELPEQEKESFLGLMEADEAAGVRRLLLYTEGTAGSMMTTEPVIVPADATVAEALARIRLSELPPALAAQVYVCRPPVSTPSGQYLGLVHFQRLLREQPSELVGGIVDTDIVPLTPHTSLPDVTRHMATYNLVAMPVVDGEQLVGAVTVDDVLDHLLPDDWRERSLHG